VNGKPRPVKVFQYECDLGLASSKPSYKRTMTIALECQRPPGGTFQSIPASDCVPLPDRCNPENCYAYRLTYQSTKILAVVVGD
jgi:hypothetical protein